MILSKPSIVSMDTIDREATLRKIEAAAKNCYQSKTKENIDDVAKFVAGLVKSGHMSPVELGGMFNVTIKTSRAVLAELSRHRLASFCVTGDTKIGMFIPGHVPQYKTVDQLYHLQETKGEKWLLRHSYRSVDEETLAIVENKLIRVVYTGDKKVYEIKTESGRTLKCTDDHPIFTPRGYIPLKDLSVGQEVWSNGVPKLDNPDWIWHNLLLGRSKKELARECGVCVDTLKAHMKKLNISTPTITDRFPLLGDEEWLYHNYIELNRPQEDIANELGCSISTVGRYIREVYKIHKPKSQLPNRRGGGPVPWDKWTEEGRQRSIVAHSGENNHWWKGDRDSLSTQGCRNWARSIKKQEIRDGVCELCGEKAKENRNLEIHHKDGNVHNNSPENLIALCSHCHRKVHKIGGLAVFKDKIKSIIPLSTERVYDLQMEAPYHNFVANGIVVHNCVESQRYVNPSKNNFGIEFAIPYNVSAKESDLTEGYYEVGMVPVQGPGGQMGMGMAVATATISPDGKLGLTRSVKCSEATGMWLLALAQAEQTYIGLHKQFGWKPEEARGVLPNDTMTTITMGANLREWKHIFNLRLFGTTGKPFPPCQEVMALVYKEFHEKLPEIFPEDYTSPEVEQSKKEPTKKSSILLSV